MPPLNLFQSERLKNLFKSFNKGYYKIEYVFTLNILSFLLLVVHIIGIIPANFALKMQWSITEILFNFWKHFFGNLFEFDLTVIKP